MRAAITITTFLVTTLFVTIKSRHFESPPSSLPHEIEQPPIPTKCLGNDNLLTEKCCAIPPFFAQEIARDCGAFGTYRDRLQEYNITQMARVAITCDVWKCLLDKYHLSVNNGLDLERFHEHMDRWLKLNPGFDKPVLDAKLDCGDVFRIQMPLDPCRMMNFVHCYRNHITFNCPDSAMVNNDICKKQKAYYNECKDYHLKK